MIQPVVESIYGFSNDALWCREGTILLDDITVPTCEKDIDGIIYAEDGLEPTDVAVFMNFYETTDKKRSPIGVMAGYLVTKVDSDGGGILVAGDLFEQDPASWVDTRIRKFFDLMYLEDYSPVDFNMPILAAHLKHIRRRNHLK
jgi:hypothetical protein